MSQDLYSQIVYASQASDSLTDADVLDIMKKSQTRNNQSGISGILLYQNRAFLQFIEGPADEIQDLFLRINADQRHKDIRILNTANSERLLMPTWAMAYCSPGQEDAAINEMFTLKQRQAQAICELLPEPIAEPFLTMLAGGTAGKTEAA